MRSWLPPKLQRLIVCPVCRATLVEPCRTVTGRARHPHPTRILGRRCPCGRTPMSGSHYCSPECRAIARRRDYWLREVRTPTRLRRRGGDVVQSG